MIVSFADGATEALFHGDGGKAIRRIPSDIRSVAVRKLDLLNAAHDCKTCGCRRATDWKH